jgi:hypothetical protein
MGGADDLAAGAARAHYSLLARWVGLSQGGVRPDLASWAALWSGSAEILLFIYYKYFPIFKSSPNFVIKIWHFPLVKNCSNFTRSCISI